MTGIREEIAKNLLYYRKKAGLTQKELAVKLGVKNTAVSNWESGNNSIDIDTLVLACDIFGVSLNAMYGKYSTPAQALDAKEEALIRDYRDASEEIRGAAAGMLHDSAERNRKDGLMKEQSAG